MISNWRQLAVTFDWARGADAAGKGSATDENTDHTIQSVICDIIQVMSHPCHRCHEI